MKTTRPTSSRKETRNGTPLLLEQQVVAQEQYDQYTATARVDAAKVDSAREAAGSALKAIAARQAEADAAQATSIRPCSTSAIRKSTRPANGIVGKRGVQLGSQNPAGPNPDVRDRNRRHLGHREFQGNPTRANAARRAGHHSASTLSARNYHGYVKNMPGASGDRFSLLPPENATGNYVKVVQRLPVRILFAARPGSRSSAASRNVGGAHGMAAITCGSSDRLASNPRTGSRRGRRSIHGRLRSRSRWRRSWSCSTRASPTSRCRISPAASAPVTTRAPGYSPATWSPTP